MKKINDVQDALIPTDDAETSVIKNTQKIPSDFMNSLKRQREDSLNTREKDYMSVASIPVLVHEKWLKEGFDLMKEPAYKIVARLKQENLDGFLTTKKRIN